MQYHPFAFARDPKRPVMSPKNPCNPLGNEAQLSPVFKALILSNTKKIKVCFLDQRRSNQQAVQMSRW